MWSMLKKWTVVRIVAFLGLIAGPAFADNHAEEVVLTVSGLPSEMSFTIADLQEIGQETFVTHTLWTEGMQVFTGVPLNEFLEFLEVEQGQMVATAINDYSVTFPIEDALAEGPMIAYHLNGSVMSVRDKGPLWIVYPYDSGEHFQTEVTHARSIWQLNRIEFKAE